MELAAKHAWYRSSWRSGSWSQNSWAREWWKPEHNQPTSDHLAVAVAAALRRANTVDQVLTPQGLQDLAAKIATQQDQTAAKQPQQSSESSKEPAGTEPTEKAATDEGEDKEMRRKRLHARYMRFSRSLQSMLGRIRLNCIHDETISHGFEAVLPSYFRGASKAKRVQKKSGVSDPLPTQVTCPNPELTARSKAQVCTLSAMLKRPWPARICVC